MLKAILMTIALSSGFIAMRPFFDPADKVEAQTAKFDHVCLLPTVFLHKGQQGFLLMDRRNANVWFIPKTDDKLEAPVFVIRVPFEKLDQSPQ